MRVRGQQWVVSAVTPGDAGSASTLVELQSVMDGRYGESLSVIWEVEPGREVLPRSSLPDVVAGGFDPPQRLAAFLDAVRWSAVTSADTKMLQAPFRSGVAIEDYQLEPVSRALDAPRVNLLLADDVGLGKTVEAGLVARELMLRHRARRVMVVCPAGLTVKWRNEMAEKFGLDFTIVDSAQCAALRRSHGSAANPFRVYPLTIVSLPWLRGAKAQRLLDEVRGDAGLFDLLILDEAHHVAPSAPRQNYAVDSQQTKLIRSLAPLFEHRLFLSATPHNGYTESFTALLEIIDDQRFARGFAPDPRAQREVVVRRLKTDIVDAEGHRKFLQREVHPIPVVYSAEELEVHRLLSQYAALRRQRFAPRQAGGRKAADLVTLLLKKRLFSSPRAFKNTVAAYLATSDAKKSGAPAGGNLDEVQDWLEGFFDELGDLDDEAMTQAEDDALGRAERMQPGATTEERDLLVRMEQWAVAHEPNPDAKAEALIDYLKAVCRPDGVNWLNERVIVFTEYRDTQAWLVQMLAQAGLGGERVAELHGGMNAAEREQLRLAFQTDPTQELAGVEEAKVRILIATDAASEGIDLQRFCHRLINYDIPFNPNKLEQRIGRVDRYGQRNTPDIRHFVGTDHSASESGWAGDLEFLDRVARKVVTAEEDLGKMNAVLADAVQRYLTGEITAFDVENAENATPASGRRKAAGEGKVAAETNVSDQVKRLRRAVDETRERLGLTPANIERAVGTALALDHQQPLTAYIGDGDSPESFRTVPTLTGSWARTVDNLPDKLTGQMRPITFDPADVRGRDDVVLAHLAHPLVAMSTQLLQQAMWDSARTSAHDAALTPGSTAARTGSGLHRVAAVVSDHPGLESTFVGAYARYVLVGNDGVRLHEEVIHAGGWLRESGRFARLENLTTSEAILSAALADGTPAAPLLQQRMAEAWPRIRDGVLNALEWRRGDRGTSLERRLTELQESEERRITTNIDRFAQSLRAELADDGADMLFVTPDPREAAQRDRDRRSWQERLDRLEEDKERALAAITARYAEPASFLFPAAVLFVIPQREARR
ncbi:DISARM system SNF2-like helicase DrmD [Kitasatospora cinereorecta]